MPPSTSILPLPRIGLLGLGWIGRRRLQALVQAKVAHIVAIADSEPAALDEAGVAAPGAKRFRSMDALLCEDLDGLVIATPSGLHFEQVSAALQRRLHVFCQKPLTRDASEARQLISSARTADRLLAVDFSYRRSEAFERALSLVKSGGLGPLYAAELTFHNAYGPDKAWCNDKGLAGGGCLIDLGVHLIDLALQALNAPTVTGVSSHLFTGGTPTGASARSPIEDYAAASFDTRAGAHIRIACSWRHHTGQDAHIEVTFVGALGAVTVRNVDGSFFDFTAERITGTSRQVLAAPPDAWEGRTIVAWAQQLSQRPHFDPSIESVCQVADVLDRMYGR